MYLQRFLSWGTLVLACVSCDEQLPPYRDPVNVFEASVSGRYTYSSTENSLKVDIVLINTFDETLEAEGILEGRATIALQRDPAAVKTINIAPSMLVKGRYNPTSGILTMSPGDTLRMTYVWDYFDDTGSDIRDRFQYTEDPKCPNLRYIAVEERFVLRASLKVFEKVNEVVMGPSFFFVCHINQWVAPNFCESIIVDESRSYCP